MVKSNDDRGTTWSLLRETRSFDLDSLEQPEPPTQASPSNGSGSDVDGWHTAGNKYLGARIERSVVSSRSVDCACCAIHSFIHPPPPAADSLPRALHSLDLS